MHTSPHTHSATHLDSPVWAGIGLQGSYPLHPLFSQYHSKPPGPGLTFGRRCREKHCGTLKEKPRQGLGGEDNRKDSFKEVIYSMKYVPRIKSFHACHFQGKINTAFEHPQGQALEKISFYSQLDHIWTRGRTHLVVNSGNCSLVKSHHLDIGNAATDNYQELGDCILQIFISIFQTFIWFERGDTKVKKIQLRFSTEIQSCLHHRKITLRHKTI